MTAAQRNCYLALDQCLDSYGLDSLLAALNEQIRDRYASRPKVAEIVVGLQDKIQEMRVLGIPL